MPKPSNSLVQKRHRRRRLVSEPEWCTPIRHTLYCTCRAAPVRHWVPCQCKLLRWCEQVQKYNVSKKLEIGKEVKEDDQRVEKKDGRKPSRWAKIQGSTVVAEKGEEEEKKKK